MTLEALLGLMGGFLTLNITINKILSNRKENKIIESVKNDIEQKFKPFTEKLKEHEIKISCAEDNIVNLKIFVEVTKTNMKYIKESLEEMKDAINVIKDNTNRTREHVPYTNLKNDTE